jgi:hypothetical protein
MNFRVWHHKVYDHIAESSELRDILSLYCDVDISLACFGRMGDFIHPFSFQWVPQVPVQLVGFDNTDSNPLELIFTCSILESHRWSILDSLDRNDSVIVDIERESMYHSCFLQITKDVVYYLSKKSALLFFSPIFCTLMDNSSLSTIIMINHNKRVPHQCKGLEYSVERVQSGKASPLSLEIAPHQSKGMKYNVEGVQSGKSSLEIAAKTETTRNLLKEFFLQQEHLTSSENLNEKESSQEMEQVGMKKNELVEKRESSERILDEDFYEMFTRVEIRNPVEILVYPATQQRILEPILNKFSMPESMPSKHEAMAVEFLRLSTMHDYPNRNGPSLLRLAQAGFFYEGNGNELVCFSCNLRLGSWSYHDSPREIHQRMSPNCRFLSESGDGNVPIPRVQGTYSYS